MRIHTLFTIAAATFAMVSCSNPANEDWTTYAEATDFRSTPRYDETIAYCQRLAKAYKEVTYTTFGVSPQGRDLPLMIIDKDGLKTPEAIRAKGRVIMMAEACIHSGEPDGKDAGLIWIRDMVQGSEDKKMLDNVSILFIPIFNVDGHENFSAGNRLNQNGPEELGTRWTAQLLNLNRDFLKADAPEMRAWLKLYSKWMPEVFMDHHVTDGADFQYVSTYEIETRCSNAEEGLRTWTRDVFEPQLLAGMEAEGYPLFPYFDFFEEDSPESGIALGPFDPRYSESYATARNRIGLLIENHIYKPYAQRVDCSIKYMQTCMRIMNEHARELREVCEAADANVASAAFRQQPFDFEFEIDYSVSKPVDFLSWERDTVISDMSGAPWIRHRYDRPKTVSTKVYSELKPTLSIRLPEAYIIPSQYDDIIEILGLHGVKLTRIPEDREIEVETYRYTGATFSPRQSEGRITASPRYTTQTETLMAHKGDYVLDMNQPSARVAAWLLEPMAPGSLAYWGFFNDILQAPNEFWIRLSYMEEKGREMMEKDPALKAEFEAKKASDPAFAKDSDAILNFFYSRVKAQAEQNNEIHPAWRLMHSL